MELNLKLDWHLEGILWRERRWSWVRTALFPACYPSRVVTNNGIWGEMGGKSRIRSPTIWNTQVIQFWEHSHNLILHLCLHIAMREKLTPSWGSPLHSCPLFTHTKELTLCFVHPLPLACYWDVVIDLRSHLQSLKAILSSSITSFLPGAPLAGQVLGLGRMWEHKCFLTIDASASWQHLLCFVALSWAGSKCSAGLCDLFFRPCEAFHSCLM